MQWCPLKLALLEWGFWFLLTTDNYFITNLAIVCNCMFDVPS